MWLTPVLLAGSLAIGSSMPVPAVPVQSSTPQACFVFGEVFWSPSQTSALLSSNCSIKIERVEQTLVRFAREIAELREQGWREA